VLITVVVTFVVCLSEKNSVKFMVIVKFSIISNSLNIYAN